MNHTQSPVNFRHFKWVYTLIFGCLLSFISFSAKSDIENAEKDIRLIVDISGSMKQNDPSNNRKASVELLLNMMPDGYYSGVWTFGKFVNMLIPLGEVNQKWKGFGFKQLHEIRSIAQFTNIEDAINRASYGWKEPGPDGKRHIILFTDGLVDISKKDALNQASLDFATAK